METEVRKLPRKTIVTIGILIALGIISFFLATAGKATKATKILAQLGFENVSKVTVYADQEILNEEINVKGMKYTVSFFNNATNEDCKGFIVKDYKNNVFKDLLCKKENN